MAEVNWELIESLAVKPHKHLNIVEGAQYGVMANGVFDTANQGVGEVMVAARTVQHLCDLAGIPEGEGAYEPHIDARVYRLVIALFDAQEQLGRIAAWHARETGPAGTVGDYCTECGARWPCDTRRMAEGTYRDEEGDANG